MPLLVASFLLQRYSYLFEGSLLEIFERIIGGKEWLSGTLQRRDRSVGSAEEGRCPKASIKGLSQSHYTDLDEAQEEFERYAENVFVLI